MLGNGVVPAQAAHALRELLRTLAIFLHELIHVIDQAVDLGLSEKQVLRLGTMLAGVLLDNGLVTFPLDLPAATDR